MKPRNIVLNLMLLMAVLLTACGGTAPDAMDQPEEKMMETLTEPAMMACLVWRFS
jgi:hypothetical protein